MKRAVLLGGPSLWTLDANIKRLPSDSYLFYIINRKAHIEDYILSQINRSADFWCVLSPPELTHQKDEVRAFLNTQTPARLITSSAAMERAFKEEPPVSEKIFLADEWIRTAYDFYHEKTGKPPLDKLINADGALNSLFILLLGLLRQNSQDPIYLFGCDGAASDYKTAHDSIYFGMEPEDQVERTNASNIYEDMVNFERYWKECLDFCGLDASCIQNINPDSHYSVFPKRSIESLFSSPLS